MSNHTATTPEPVRDGNSTAPDVSLYIGGRLEVAARAEAPDVVVGRQAHLLRSVEGWIGRAVRVV